MKETARQIIKEQLPTLAEHLLLDEELTKKLASHIANKSNLTVNMAQIPEETILKALAPVAQSQVALMTYQLDTLISKVIEERAGTIIKEQFKHQLDKLVTKELDRRLDDMLETTLVSHQMLDKTANQFSTRVNQSILNLERAEQELMRQSEKLMGSKKYIENEIAHQIKEALRGI